jgi:hypothetical protein
MTRFLEVVDAHETLLEIADFFHVVVHKTEDVKPGTDVKELARAIGIPIPESLAGGSITASDRAEEAARGRSIVVRYGDGDPKPPEEPGTIAKQKCFKVCKGVGPAKVCFNICVSCSLAKLSCEVTITITVVVSL